MRHFAGAFVCALFALGLVPEAAHAQSIAPITAPKFETEPFAGAELLGGKRIMQAECAALPGAVWVAVDQQESASAIITRPLAVPGPSLWSSFPPKSPQRMLAGR